jgi:hypothetical protein
MTTILWPVEKSFKRVDIATFHHSIAARRSVSDRLVDRMGVVDDYIVAAFCSSGGHRHYDAIASVSVFQTAPSDSGHPEVGSDRYTVSDTSQTQVFQSFQPRSVQ